MKLNFDIVNADTDSITITKGAPLSEKEQTALLESLNLLMPKGVLWTHDGYFSSMLVVKAKNYAYINEKGELKIKGAALKATYKEAALRAFLKQSIITLMDGGDLLSLYEEVVQQIHLGDIDISEWSAKKTITEKVLFPKRANELKVLDALKEAGVTPQQGDKVFVYFREDKTLGLASSYKKDHDRKRLFQKLYDTVGILEPVIKDFSRFKNYKLKRNLVDSKS